MKHLPRDGKRGWIADAEKLPRESPFNVWQERMTSLLHTRDLENWT